MKVRKSQENTILYELLIYAEWSQDPEIFEKNKFDGIDGNKGSLWGWLNSFTLSSTVPPCIQKFVNLQMPWQFSVGGEGKVVAVLQDQCVEIRSSRDDYGTILGRCTIPSDPYPQWRKICWSPDCSLLAVAFSCGSIHFFDLLGSRLFTVFARKKNRKSHSNDISDSVAGMVFTDTNIKNSQWSSEFLVATYKGKLYSFLVSSTDGYQENHMFSFRKRYPRGITALVYHSAHQVLFVSGEVQFHNANETPAKGFHYGITAWRVLSDYPHYQLITTLEDEINLGKRHFLNKFSSFPFYGAAEEELVFKMSISPNGQLLAASHTSGALTLWHLPSLRLVRTWFLNDQPEYGTHDQNLYGKKNFVRSLMPVPVQDLICDISWWSDDALILARYSGSLTISSVSSMNNLLGDCAEWFEPSSQVSLAYNSAFLVLECVCSISTKSKTPLGTNEDNDEDDDHASLLKQGFRFISRMLYFLTDIEYFQPPKRKKKFLHKSVQLVCLKSTTPEELFVRKIDNEEYGEALVLAKMYGLDCDLVYQRQWRKSSASVAAIQDYLSKIKKRQWVLHECLEKVPENIDAAKELLLYGLLGTNLETLIAIGKGEDQGRFYCQKNKKSDVSIDEFLKQIDFDTLTLEQKQLCQYRLKLFGYLDRLSTYEIILGGPQAAGENYDHKFFRVFRCQSGFQAAIDFARNGDGKAVSSMLTYHGAETLKHWLVILSNFPETTPPSSYKSILPEAGYGPEEPEVYPWDEMPIREKDWCELLIKKINMSLPIDEFEEEFYEDLPELSKYSQSYLTSEMLTEWYSERARNIVQWTGLVDCSLGLVKYGRERNVKGLEKLYNDLVTLETLVYECQLEKCFMFDDLARMTDIEKVNLLMSNSTTEKYLRNVRQWLIPYLERVEKLEAEKKIPLLRAYLVSTAKTDFNKCKLFFTDSRPDQNDPLIDKIEDLLSLALDCVYSCESTDELSNCFSILECLPQRSDLKNPPLDALHDKIDAMEKHLSVSEILLTCGVCATPAYVRECESTPEEVRKLFVRVATTACNKTPSLQEAQWKELLKSMLDMRAKVFTCITNEVCFEVIAEALLNSSKKENILLSSNLMECGQKSAPGSFFKLPLAFALYSRKLPFERSVALILTAAQMYFNDAASLSDPSIDLAKTCLQLVQDDHPQIERERNLISALGLLREFSVNVIPLQVQLCANKLDLMEKALSSKIGAYKNCQKLLRLAMLLGLCEGNKVERDGQVLTLISKAALEDMNYSFCYQICQQIMELRYQGGWSVCHRLSQCSDFEDIHAKFELLNYALTFCTSDLLEPILTSKKTFELQDVQMRLSTTLKSLEENSQPIDEVINTKPYNIVQEILHSATQTTKGAISAFGRKPFWRDAMKWISALNAEANEFDDEESNKDLNLLGVPFFYASLYDNCHLSKHDTTYIRYVLPDIPKTVQIGQDLLKAYANDLQTSLSSSVLLDVAHLTISEDYILSLAYLLSLTDPAEANHVFEKMNTSAVGLQLAVYYFALSSMTNSHSESNFYSWDFNTIIAETEKLIKKNSSEHSDVQKLFMQYKQQLIDYCQAEVLRKLYCQSSVEIDIVKFSHDEEYKKETLFQLARGVEDVFKAVKNLAKKYNISMFELYMVRLGFLLGAKRVDMTAVKKEIESHGFTEVLLANRTDFVTRMYEVIVPVVETSEGLSLCYELLRKYGDEPDGNGKKPSFHLKMMKKLDSLNVGINYAYLMNAERSTSVLRTHLTSETVNTFTKIATHIPCEGGYHSSSSVFSLWAEKMFFHGNSGSKLPSTFTEWNNRYKTCIELFEKMVPADFLRFINNITFDTFAIDELSETSRIEITRRAMRYCKQTERAAQGGKENWSRAFQELQTNLEHLEKLDCFLVLSLKATDNVYATKFDATRSISEKVEELILQAVMEGRPLETVQTLLALSPSQLAMDTADAFSKAIVVVSEEIRHSEQHPYLVGKQPLEVLESILMQVLEDGEILSEDSILELLRPLCCDNSVPGAQVAVIDLLENMFTFSEEDSAFLMISKTQALVSSTWSTVEVNEASVENVDSKTKLAEELFSDSFTILQLKTLADLLLYWPLLPLCTIGDPTQNIWVRLLKSLMSQAKKDDLNEVIKILKKITQKTDFSEKCSWTLYHSIVRKKSTIHTLKLAMLTRHRYIQKAALQDVANSTTFSESDYDMELLDWLLEQELVTETLNTPLHRVLMEHVVSTCKENTVNDITKALRAEGHRAEADSLLALYAERIQPRSTGTLRSAISSLTRWLPGSDTR